MYTETILNMPAGMWALEFTVVGPTETLDTLISLDAADYTLSVTQLTQYIHLEISTHTETENPRFPDKYWFDFTLESNKTGSRYRIEWLESVIRLYVDGMLVDEEWPLGQPVQGECVFVCSKNVRDLRVTALSERPAEEDISLPCPAQFYMPPYHNASVGDCMPFVSGGRYRLVHLFDRRHHQSKSRLGAHQWAQISSDNLRDWTLHPMTIGIDEQWEGSICTGSMIEYNHKIYAFYAVRMSDGSPAKLSWAVSEDGVHFEKSRQYFTLTAPYEPTSARDPKVFKDPDGLYHMLVTTSIMDGRTRPGCLAHLTSRDLTNWEQHEPFIVPGYPGQPECSDYFEWNGIYYLSFANHLNARYRISKNPFGPWERPVDDIVVSPNLAVPKMANFNGRCLVSGWLGDGGWGGWAITFELYQRKDHSLGVKYVEEMMPKLSFPALRPVCADAADGYAECALTDCSDSFRIRGTVSLDQSAVGELILNFGGNEYRIAFDPLEKTVSFTEPKDRPLDVNAHSRLINVKGMDKPFDIDLIVYGKILMLLLPDGRLLQPSRLEHSGACSLSIACRDGKVTFMPHN